MREGRRASVCQIPTFDTVHPSRLNKPPPFPKQTGFPRHHRVLHVKQEVRSSGKTVLETVLQSDVEREMLLEEEREILARQQRKDVGADGAAEATGE